MWPFSKKDIPQPRERKFASFLLGGGIATWSGRNYNAYAREGYAENPVVHACVSKLAKSCASVELQVYRQDRGKLVKLEDHPLLDLLARPNPTTSGRKFVERLASYYLIGGEAFVLRSGPDNELHLLSPEHMEVKPGNYGFPAYYEYKPGQADAKRYAVDPLTGESEILHLKTFNPLDPWRGLSPMRAAAYGIDIFADGQKWNKALLQNEGRPSGALIMKEANASLTDEQYARLKADIDAQYSGSGNAGRPLLLEGGMEWKEMGLNARDMDHRETMLTVARFIASVYHTPPQLVNIPGESTYSNYGQATLAYWGDTVLPLLTSFLDDLNIWLAPLYGEGIYLWYDEEMIPALEPRRKEKSDRLNAANYLTPDEKRRAMGHDDYAPTGKPGGSLYVQSSEIPIDLAGLTDDLSEPGSEQAPEPEPEG